ncbi:Eukaryotic initiation factor 4A-II [Tritrichomonas musculus]|uniref:Eukaryotic initiation factor 4A-II n=1 Tax=Tritrichomonas musculus TaxID=1915356 RepID=A0ABR2J2C0_9EUKA
MSNRFRYTPCQNNYTNNNIFEPNWEERIEEFDQFELKPKLLLAINPISLGRNVIAQSPNCTGRSLAFIIGILQQIKIEEKTT